MATVFHSHGNPFPDNGFFCFFRCHGIISLSWICVLGAGRSKRWGKLFRSSWEVVRLFSVAVRERRGGAGGEQRRDAAGPFVHHRRATRRGGLRLRAAHRILRRTRRRRPQGRSILQPLLPRRSHLHGTSTIQWGYLFSTLFYFHGYLILIPWLPDFYFHGYQIFISMVTIFKSHGFTILFPWLPYFYGYQILNGYQIFISMVTIFLFPLATIFKSHGYPILFLSYPILFPWLPYFYFP